MINEPKKRGPKPKTETSPIERMIEIENEQSKERNKNSTKIGDGIKSFNELPIDYLTLSDKLDAKLRCYEIIVKGGGVAPERVKFFGDEMYNHIINTL